MKIERTLKNKIIFKLVRLPIPWSIRRLLNKLYSLLTLKYKKSSNNKIGILLREGTMVTSCEELGIDINTEDLEQRAKNLPLFDQWDREKEPFSFSNVEASTNTGVVIMDEELDRITDDIGEYLRNSDIVKSYFNSVPLVNNKVIWWSFPDRKEREAQLWHRDIDNLYFLKCFVYLNDVDQETAPHFYVNKSHRWNKLLSFGRFTDKELKQQGLNVPTQGIVGKRGTIIFEDTFGLHRGSSPTNEKHRCLLQFQFASFRNP